ncbi:hypothetical protein SEPCBS119000_003306 [Sporothrix epigloea]|uniref:Mitochondrial carrier protein n=1 Tax=Sporothrix epigloea TaxID=1892477 RepID=A0ABP0DPK7_9PEZI
MGEKDSSPSKSDNDTTHREIMLAGAFAAFTVDLLVYPLDTIKTRMQSRDYMKTYAEKSSTLKRAAVPSAYALRGLYQGIGSVILATLPASGVFFTTYEWAKTVTGSALSTVTGGPAPSALVHALSSGTAELASCAVLTPAEVIKQNAQMIRTGNGAAGQPGQPGQPGQGRSGASTSLQALHMLARAEGGAVRRLLSGYTALAARNLPFTAIQFPLFEAMRVRLGRWWSSSSSENASTGGSLALVGAVNGLSAGVSGSLAAVITTPTDVVKTRMMLGADTDQKSAQEKGARHSSRRPGALHLARVIYREHGVRGLFRGGAFRAGWTFLGSGLYLGTYEVAKAYLRGDTGEGDEEEAL